MTGGIEALTTAVAPGPAPVKAERALAVAEEVLSAPVADRPNWTLPRLADEVETRSGMRISRSRLSVVLRQRGVSAGDGPAAGWSRLTRHIQDRLTVSRQEGQPASPNTKGHSSQARWPDRSGLCLKGASVRRRHAMKLFECQSCGQLLFFENRRCEKCARQLGYLPGANTLSALEADGPSWGPLALPTWLPAPMRCTTPATGLFQSTHRKSTAGGAATTASSLT